MVHISGPRAEVRVGYQVASVLGEWEITPTSERRNTFTFSARVVAEHPVWMDMTPLDLYVKLGTTTWIWRNIVVVHGPGGIEVSLTERPVVMQGAV